MGGRWAYIEVGVPDTLYQYQNYLSASINLKDFSLYIIKIWNGSIYNTGTYFDTTTAANRSLNSNSTKFLDGSTFKTVYGETQNYYSQNSFAELRSGFKGATTIRCNIAAHANQSITYNGVGGCKRRIGFAIKMPPADGLASSTTGISQAKLKLEVYVP